MAGGIGFCVEAITSGQGAYGGAQADDPVTAMELANFGTASPDTDGFRGSSETPSRHFCEKEGANKEEEV